MSLNMFLVNLLEDKFLKALRVQNVLLLENIRIRGKREERKKLHCSADTMIPAAID